MEVTIWIKEMRCVCVCVLAGVLSILKYIKARWQVAIRLPSAIFKLFLKLLFLL